MKEYNSWDLGTSGPIRGLKAVDHAFLYHEDTLARELRVF